MTLPTQTLESARPPNLQRNKAEDVEPLHELRPRRLKPAVIQTYTSSFPTNSRNAQSNGPNPYIDKQHSNSWPAETLDPVFLNHGEVDESWSASILKALNSGGKYLTYSVLTRCMSQLVLEVHDLCKSYGSVVALDCASCELYEGELLGLIGDNGAGKSTLLNMLAGYSTPDSGEILLNGQKIRDLDPVKARRLGMGMVHQVTALVQKRLIYENFYATMEKEKKIGFIKFYDYQAMKNELENYFKKFNLDIDVRRRIEQLSGGQRQLVQLLRVFYMDTPIVLLDEPFASLSRAARDLVSDFIRRYRSEKSMVLVSHDLLHVKELSDRILVMKRGKIVKSVGSATPVEDLLRSM